ncbi:MAG: ABC transporter ATP-binding protein [Firmicutes bacterium]|nr:ABC transporter ATP-binding protein [Candidatus Fermentithermobacillaceae bacterium]
MGAVSKNDASLTLPAVVREMSGYLRRPWGMAASFSTTLLLRAVTPVATAIFLARCLDALASGDCPRFLTAVCLYIAGYVLETVGTTWSMLVRVNLTESVASELRKRFVERTMDIPLNRYDRLSRWDLVSRLTADIGGASRVLAEAHVILSMVLRAVGVVLFLVFVATRLGIAVIATLALAAFMNSRAGRALGGAGKEYHASLGSLSSYALNALEGHAVIKAFNAQGYVSGAFSERVRAVRDKGLYLAARVSGSILGAFGGASCVALMAFGYGAYLTATGRITIGAMIASFVCTDHISPLGRLGQNFAELKRGIGAYSRVKEITEAEVDADLPEDPAAGRLDISAGDALIVVKDLSYEYEPGVKVLRDVSFEVRRGQKVAVVGRSGCGKSTLMKILAGLYRPEPGRVYIGGLDMAYHRLARLSGEVTYVPQEPFLFAGSVADNLALGLLEPVVDSQGMSPKVQRGLEMAGALGFVLENEEGLSAQVGERGSLLSGGQRQRLCLARGFLRDTPVLLLDEPTSSVDRETEAGILSAIASRKDLTCFIVTHRFDVAEVSDLVLVMDSGLLVEAGTHEELMRRKGLYWALFTGEISLSTTPSPHEGSDSP